MRRDRMLFLCNMLCSRRSVSIICVEKINSLLFILPVLVHLISKHWQVTPMLSRLGDNINRNMLLCPQRAVRQAVHAQILERTHTQIHWGDVTSQGIVRSWKWQQLNVTSMKAPNLLSFQSQLHLDYFALAEDNVFLSINRQQNKMSSASQALLFNPETWTS